MFTAKPDLIVNAPEPVPFVIPQPEPERLLPVAIPEREAEPVLVPA